MSDDDAYERADEMCAAGNALFVDEQYDEALEKYTEALALAPRHTDALVRRAQTKLSLEDAVGALADADAALEIDSTHDMAFLRRGAALLALKRPAEALVALEKGEAVRGAPQFGGLLRKARVALAESGERRQSTVTTGTNRRRT
eukprot:TRINITY_DN904_c0_g1_i2.p3 TRINITY_DN904_c0_g1~~TRINITY_DN904_c0_g1_i2.p3  ORF type:complete len:145 (-),score=44.90 TRINITY_DN904_c0_g1_i2:586-1020(-)